jgi:hypothetical protein
MTRVKQKINKILLQRKKQKKVMIKKMYPKLMLN